MSSQALNRRKIATNNKEPQTVTNSDRQHVVNDRTRSGSLIKQMMSRIALTVTILVVVYYITGTDDHKELVMASASESIPGSPKGQQVICSNDYNEDRQRFGSCAPKLCGRFVSDAVVTESEAKHLLSVAKKGLSLGGSSGSASILDLHSGALSMDTNFVNIYKLMKKMSKEDIFTDKDFEIYRTVKNKILQTIAIHFGISGQHLFLTDPTFFSRLTSEAAKTKHDEYWHKHIDKNTYKSFHFTSLVYLSTYGRDFTGGRFVFIDKTIQKNITIEPKLGRLSAFTSGSENEHYVERVTSGTRFAITVSFTCDPKYAISDPMIATNNI
ncbi:2-oxoglutarate and iron-dependent oxygenase domain-containing protein 3-like [Oppia nitens]|uniref:2-oxoglutarate and iron-dependent oxygenase domain-containing protein 3-like n=1 Tax=Oppia nitens TaxID=1686743 RepID=UPI0023DB972F|nr:2-oxoglutarate and iron-dependent oxygenase domain-containing protein 3-like [Oppia nitens]